MFRTLLWMIINLLLLLLLLIGEILCALSQDDNSIYGESRLLRGGGQGQLSPDYPFPPGGESDDYYNKYGAHPHHDPFEGVGDEGPDELLNPQTQPPPRSHPDPTSFNPQSPRFSRGTLQDRKSIKIPPKVEPFQPPPEPEVTIQELPLPQEGEDQGQGQESPGPSPDINMGELPDIDPDEQLDDPSGPENGWIEWCENGVRKRVTGSQCQEITFVPPFPTCYCINGIVSVRLDRDRNCGTALLWGMSGGCYNFEALGHGARSLRIEKIFTKKSFIIATESRTEDWDSHWSFLESTGGGVAQRGLRVLNGFLTQNPEADYCVQKRAAPTGTIRVYKNIYGLINVSTECDGMSIRDSRFVMDTPIVTQEFQLCTPLCPEFQAPATLTDRSGGGQGDFSSLTPAESCKRIPFKIKSLHEDLNRRLLTRTILKAFTPDVEEMSLKPIKSFKILNQISGIAGKVCASAGVDRLFLETAMDMFQVAHEGRGYYFHEYFEESHFRAITSLLSDCESEVDELEFKKTPCEGEIISVFNGTTGFTKVHLSEDHTFFDHHVVLDIPWNLIDLINMVCIKSFRSSYRSYHEMEQGMEKLFTKELRSFWQYPDLPRKFYERLFGPFWAHKARNLELCVEGAYANQNKVWRLNRPTWVSGGLGQKGTRSPKICKRKRTNDPTKTLSSVYEIYCDPMNCQ